MNKFRLVSKEAYVAAMQERFPNVKAKAEIFAETTYNDLVCPKRATIHSAGYDFFAPFDIIIPAGKSIKFPTGYRVELDPDKFLMVVPRSGLGFKYRCQLDNTVGIIDADYYFSDNEGQMWVKLTNDSREGKTIEIKAGEAYCQGIILQYHVTDDDDADGIRNGGFGSTTK